MQWIYDFEVPYDKCSSGLKDCLIQQTIPDVMQRKELIHLTIDEVLKVFVFIYIPII